MDLCGRTMGWVGYVWICVVGPWVGLDIYMRGRRHAHKGWLNNTNMSRV